MALFCFISTISLSLCSNGHVHVVPFIGANDGSIQIFPYDGPYPRPVHVRNIFVSLHCFPCSFFPSLFFDVFSDCSDLSLGLFLLLQSLLGLQSLFVTLTIVIVTSVVLNSPRIPNTLFLEAWIIHWKVRYFLRSHEIGQSVWIESWPLCLSAFRFVWSFLW